MSEYTVIATPRSFALADPAPIELLRAAGCEVIRLPREGGCLAEQLPEYLPLADAVIAGLERYDRPLMQRAERLRVISRYGVGCDNIDLPAARELGIAVTNTPAANADSVADLAFALMLAAARHICPMAEALRAGSGAKPISGTELWGKTLGVVGAGRIGKGVIRRAAGFRMRVLACDAFPDEGFMAEQGCRRADLDTLFREADFISLHCPLTPETRYLADARRLSLMKPTAVLVNTARGGLVDEAALYSALKAGRIAAAALDSTEVEPPLGSPLLELPNCILTPHAGAATREAAANMGLLAAQNLLAVLQGRGCEYTVN